MLPIWGYQYRQLTSDVEDPWVDIGSQNPVHLLRNLDNATAYTFQVRARN